MPKSVEKIEVKVKETNAKKAHKSKRPSASTALVVASRVASNNGKPAKTSGKPSKLEKKIQQKIRKAAVKLVDNSIVPANLPNKITRPSFYNLNEFLNILVADFNIQSPASLGNTNGSGGTSPVKVKAYLYWACIHAFRERGILLQTSANDDNWTFPNFGQEWAIPTALAKYLEWGSPHVTSQGVSFTPSWTAIGSGGKLLPDCYSSATNLIIAPGQGTGYMNSSMQTSVYPFTLGQTVSSVVQPEFYALTTGAGSFAWNTVFADGPAMSEFISTLPISSVPYHRVPKHSPDASIGAVWYVNSDDCSTLVGCHARKFDPEVSLLFNGAIISGQADSANYPYFKPLPAYDYQVGVDSLVNDCIQFAAFSSLCMISRQTKYRPGPLKKFLKGCKYGGLKYLLPRTYWMDHGLFVDAVEEYALIGSSSLAGQAAFKTYASAMMLRRLRDSALVSGDTNNWNFVVSDLFTSALLPGPLAEVVSKAGPVVAEGRLHVPCLRPANTYTSYVKLLVNHCNLSINDDYLFSTYSTWPNTDYTIGGVLYNVSVFTGTTSNYTIGPMAQAGAIIQQVKTSYDTTSWVSSDMSGLGGFMMRCMIENGTVSPSGQTQGNASGVVKTKNMVVKAIYSAMPMTRPNVALVATTGQISVRISGVGSGTDTSTYKRWPFVIRFGAGEPFVSQLLRTVVDSKVVQEAIAFRLGRAREQERIAPRSKGQISIVDLDTGEELSEYESVTASQYNNLIQNQEDVPRAQDTSIYDNMVGFMQRVCGDECRANVAHAVRAGAEKLNDLGTRYMIDQLAKHNPRGYRI